MKAHSVEQIAAWAKSWNMKGYEHLYPENREKARQNAIKYGNENRRKESDQRDRKST